MSINCRTTLWYLVFVGVLNFVNMLANINIAIMSMVKKVVNETDLNVTTNEYNDDEDEIGYIIDDDLHTGFEWTEFQQGLILGAPFLLYCVMQIPGGLVANRFGPKFTFGVPNVIAAFLSFLVPTAAYHSFEALLVLRIIHGITAGICFPSLHAITAKWIPPNERSHFITTYLASALSVALVYPLFGWVASVSRWENVFYISGTMTVVWYAFWYFLMYDTPADHPRISDEERAFIEDALNGTVHTGRLPTPWKSILTSPQVWVNVFANIAYGFVFMIEVTYFAIYFNAVHDTSLSLSAQLAGLPHLLRFFTSFVFGRLADNVIRSKKLPRTNVRRLATSLCTSVAGIAFICLAFSGSSLIAAATFVTVVILCSAFPNAGFFASMVDIAPNFASIIFALCTVAAGFTQTMVTVFVGWMTNGNQSDEQWRKIYLVTAIIAIVPGTVYAFVAKSDVVSWNNPRNEKGEEMVKLNEEEIRARTKAERIQRTTAIFGSSSVF